MANQIMAKNTWFMRMSKYLNAVALNGISLMKGNYYSTSDKERRELEEWKKKVSNCSVDTKVCFE